MFFAVSCARLDRSLRTTIAAKELAAEARQLRHGDRGIRAHRQIDGLQGLIITGPRVTNISCIEILTSFTPGPVTYSQARVCLLTVVKEPYKINHIQSQNKVRFLQQLARAIRHIKGGSRKIERAPCPTGIASSASR
jgi:hypothetical protein